MRFEPRKRIFRISDRQVKGYGADRSTGFKLHFKLRLHNGFLSCDSRSSSKVAIEPRASKDPEFGQTHRRLLRTSVVQLYDSVQVWLIVGRWLKNRFWRSAAAPQHFGSPVTSPRMVAEDPK